MARGLVIAAPNSGSGKTVVTLGLLRALRERGLAVASAKVGPDYIDPRFHDAATGRPCFNIDPWAMAPDVAKSLLTAYANSCDIVLIEGVMGLFDGPQGAAGSTADLAAMLGLPVVLVIDARHQSQSVAALLHGFATYRQDIDIAGVILNRVASDRHEAILREALGKRVIGALRQNDSLSLPSRHLGLVQAAENQELEQFISGAASAVSRETNLDKLLTICAEVPDSTANQYALPPLAQSIAIANDEAFSFLYSHLTEFWRAQGATLSFFSPLANEAPDPAAGAVFLPGGYPELHAGKLSNNKVFLDGLQAHKGLVYGECGGYMVLGEGLIDAAGTRHAMAGILPVTTTFASRKLHLGYRQLRGGSWSSPLRGHEFHYSTIAHEGPAPRLFEAWDAAGNPLNPMGLRVGNVMGSYAHVISEAP